MEGKIAKLEHACDTCDTCAASKLNMCTTRKGVRANVFSLNAYAITMREEPNRITFLENVPHGRVEKEINRRECGREPRNE